MMFVFLVTALAPSLCLALGLKVMFEAERAGVGCGRARFAFLRDVLGSKRIDESASPPTTAPQPCAVRASAEYPATRNSLPSGRWNHRTKNCTARNPAGRCFYRRSRQHYANDWKPTRKPFHGPRSFPVLGGAGRSPIVEAQQSEFHRARPAGDFGGSLYTWAY